MKHRWTLLLVFCVIQLAMVSVVRGQATLVTLRTNGPTSSHINLVYLSEGYTAAQLPQFLVDATNTMNKLMAIPPWNSYSNYFNVFAISVASAQSGSDHYTPTTNLVNTYFNSSYDSFGIQRLLTIPPNDHDGSYFDGSGKVATLLQQLMPEGDVACLIVNDPIYGGSGGQYLLASLNSASAEIANHEIGHTFAFLGDEYSDPYPGYPSIEEPNTTTNATRGVKWNAWILPSTLVPTPDVSSNYLVDGLFQGAHYESTGWYRPKHDCKMRTLGVPYCEICAQELVLSMYRVIRPILNFSPATAHPTVGNQGSASFKLSVLKPSTNSLTVQWFTNGVPASLGSSTNFTIDTTQLGIGTNEIKAVVHDPTGYVRTDRTGALWETNIWNVAVVPVPTISNLNLTGDALTLSVLPTQIGFNYVLEFKDSLSDPIWTPVQTNGGNGGSITLTDNGLASPTRFYHIRIQ
jgi:hypothetical protein